MAVIFNVADPNNLHPDFEQGFIDLLTNAGYDVQIVGDFGILTYDFFPEDVCLIRYSSTSHPYINELASLPAAIISMDHAVSDDGLGLGTDQVYTTSNWSIDSEAFASHPFFDFWDDGGYSWGSFDPYTINTNQDLLRFHSVGTDILFGASYEPNSTTGLAFHRAPDDLSNQTRWRIHWSAFHATRLIDQMQHLFLQLIAFTQLQSFAPVINVPDLLRDFVFTRTTDIVTVDQQEIPVNDVSLLPTNEELAAGNFFLSFEASLTVPNSHETVRLVSVDGLLLTVERGHAGTTAKVHDAFTFLRGIVTADMLRRARSVWVLDELPAPQAVDGNGETQERIVREGLPVYSRSDEQLFLLIDGEYVPAAAALALSVAHAQKASLRLAVEVEELVEHAKRNDLSIRDLRYLLIQMAQYIETARSGVGLLSERIDFQALASISMQRRVEEVLEAVIVADERARIYRREYHLTQDVIATQQYLPAGVNISDSIELESVTLRVGTPSEGEEILVSISSLLQAGDLVPEGYAVTSTGRDGTVHTVEIVESGTYRLQAWGSVGGRTSVDPGKGAWVRGDFVLAAGTTLKILVGQRGLDTTSGVVGTGGGGGTFIWIDGTDELLLAAAGGGGAGDGALGTDGLATEVSNTDSGGEGAQGIVGEGGLQIYSWAGAGAGWNSDGQTVQANVQGIRPLAGGQGGDHTYFGGYGGAGAGSGTSGDNGGGGGGYTGGPGGHAINRGGGGGGSYNGGANPVGEPGVRDSAGRATVALIDTEERVLFERVVVSIPAGEYEATTETVSSIPAGTLWFEVTQVGSTTPGTGLAVELLGKREI